MAHLNCRFIVPYEAAWGLFEFPIHFRQPSVERLAIHLPYLNNVVFNASAKPSSVIQRPDITKTMLTEWFELNKHDADATLLTYSQIPSKYVWSPDLKVRTKRLRGRSIGRIAYVNPAAGELYYMRILLNIIKGPSGFEDLRTVKGLVCSDFQAACHAHGLLGDDRKWNEAMEEARSFASAAEIRQLFVTVVMYCGVADANALLQSHWRSMSDDILHKLRQAFSKSNLVLPDPELKNAVLYELELLFIAASSSMALHHLLLPDEKMNKIRNKLVTEELDYDINDLKQQHTVMITKLNAQQRLIHDSVINSVLTKKPAVFFVHGHLGTGKRFLWHVIISKIRSESRIVLAVASSGIASLLLPGGRTAHSRFKIPLLFDEVATCRIKKGTHLARLICKADLIVWDEAPMNNKRCFEALNRTLCDLSATI